MTHPVYGIVETQCIAALPSGLYMGVEA